MPTYVWSEVLTTVVTSVTIFWDVVSCSPYVDQRVHARFLPGRFSTLNLEVIASSETSVHIWARRRYILEDLKTPDVYYIITSLCNLQPYVIRIIILVCTFSQHCERWEITNKKMHEWNACRWSGLRQFQCLSWHYILAYMKQVILQCVRLGLLETLQKLYKAWSARGSVITVYYNPCSKLLYD
jgi:hypothetical protein